MHGRPHHTRVAETTQDRPSPSGTLTQDELTPGTSTLHRPQCPIAIVGMGAEFPGADSPESLWRILQEGLNTIEEIPPSRFDVSAYVDNTNSHGRSMDVSKGNFIMDPGRFDHAFFQTSPREARSMDPQQRLLLRIAYRALESAGYCPNATPSSDPGSFGAFVGVATHDYVHNLKRDIDVYYSTGTLQAFLSGRLSYAFGFCGPSIVFDTACSSSIVAIHQACRSLANGDCNAALAGGVNVITSPDMYLGLSRGHFLSATGQCRPWDASADGYCRSEGCGVFVFKRLDDAVNDNDRILAVIRGVEVNQSGNARSITHPHAPTQTALFEKLVFSSGIRPCDVNVVECHGTGTQAGDPVELEAIRKVFAVGRSDGDPLHITSVKANIGHAEAASGAASLVKLILMMRERTIPAHVSFKELNPRIPDLSVDNVLIDTTPAPWDCKGPRRLSVLTNFGAAGSNGALVLEEYIPTPRPNAASRSIVVGLSCKTAGAAEQLREACIHHFENTVHDGAALQDLAYSTTARRQLYKYRVSASGYSKDEVLRNLRLAPVVQAQPNRSKVVFVFSGQGSQHLGMGVDLYRQFATFARVVDECNAYLLAIRSVGVMDIFQGRATAEFMTSRSHQEALFVLEYALARLWMSWGVRPCAVVGISFGEFAALTIAGVLTLQDALFIVSQRAALISTECVPNQSGMTAVVQSSIDPAQSLRDPRWPHLEVCCYTSETGFVIGGDLEELSRWEEVSIARGERHTRLDVPFAYHTAAMDPILDDLQLVLESVSTSPPNIPVLSNVTGELIMPGERAIFDLSYFVRHCRNPAQFKQGMAHMAVRIDISTVAANAPGPETLCATLAQLYCTAVPVKWRDVFADVAPDARLVDLPPYPFAETRFWVPYEEDVSRAPSLASYVPPNHSPGRAGQQVFSDTAVSTLADLMEGHQVAGVPLCPASVYVELVTSAATSVLGGLSTSETYDAVLELVGVVYLKPLVHVSGNQDVLRVEVSPSEGRDGLVGDFVVTSGTDGKGEPEVYSKGSLKRVPAELRARKFAYVEAMVKREIELVLRTDPASQPETFRTRTVYDVLFPAIVTYSDIYRTIQTITVESASSTAYALIQLPPAAQASPLGPRPVFIDTLYHVAGFLVNFTRGMNGTDAYICSHTDKVQLLADVLDLSARYGVYAAVTSDAEGAVAVDVYALEVDGPWARIVARLKRVVFSRVGLQGFKRALQSAAEKLVPAGVRHEVPTKAASTVFPVEPETPLDLHHDVRRVIAETAGIPLEDAEESAHLAHLGIDSLMLWEVAAQLRTVVPGPGGSRLDSRTLSAATTVGELVRLVMDSCVEGHSLPASSTADSVATLCGDDVPILQDARLPRDESDSERAVKKPPIDLAAVKSILSSVLDIPAVDIAEDAELQALGLDSLTSIEARYEFQTRLGVKVHEQTLFDCRTVSDIFQVVSSPARSSLSHPTFISPASPSPTEHRKTSKDEHDEQHKRPLIIPVELAAGDPILKDCILGVDRILLLRIQRAPPGRIPPPPPLFLIHDGSGDVRAYQRLAPLGRDVWALKNTDYTRSFASPRDTNVALREMVDMLTVVYLGLLTPSFFFDGGDMGYEYGDGCYVGGWSFGGVVASALAQNLLRMGFRVRGLVLLDAPAPQTQSALPPWLVRAVAARAAGPRDAFARWPAHLMDAARERAQRCVEEQMRTATRALVGYDHATQGRGPYPPVVYLRASEPDGLVVSGVAAGEQIDPSVHAFLTKSGEDSTLDLWKAALGGQDIPVVDVPGSHFTMFSGKNVHALSERLGRWLDSSSTQR
ncbi:ketoacyl-synt-domain-containing protein [Trametes elegans]|nr:ketoacyl-synt-domain-containing protein [Trametes elegans]